MNPPEEIRALGRNAREAARELSRLSSRRKNLILEAMARETQARRAQIAEANRMDLEAARAAGRSPAVLDRLELTEPRLDEMIRRLRDIVALPDPVGKRISRWIRPNGLVIHKIRVPIGVVAVVYESRPHVTADAAALCLKASSAVLLEGCGDAARSNRAIADALQEGGIPKGLPRNAVQLLETGDEEDIRNLVRLEGLVDLVVPRGGEALVRTVVEAARVPVLKHAPGVCHVYVDVSADPEMALRIIENAKCGRPAVCHAAEAVLVHEAVAPAFLPRLVERLAARGVELRGDETARGICPSMAPASDSDWGAAFHGLILAVRVLPDAEAAITHINRHGSGLSDAIVAEDEAVQDRFCREVDTAAVYVNASTRFTDAGEFGMGAEIGISTEKLHARGPIGLEELTTYKFVIHGEGQIRG